MYKEIPVMPIVGPLMGRPKIEGQVAYMMLINYGNGITKESKVSVVMGKYKREHIRVIDDEFIPEDNSSK